MLRLACIIGLALCIASSSLSALTEEQRAFSEEILAEIYELHPETVTKIRAYEAAHPEHPLATAMMATYSFSNYLVTGDEDGVDENLQRAAKVAKAYRKRNRDDPEAHYFLGLARANIARFAIERGKNFSAARASRGALNSMEEVLERDPDQVDAMMALGVMNGYMDDVPGFLKPLAFLFGLRGDLETGLKQLEHCAEEGFFSRVEARFYLVDIHRQITKDYAESVRHSRILFTQAPQHPVFALNHVLSLHRAGYHDELIAAAETYLAENPRFVETGPALDLRLHLATVLYMDKARHASALEHARFAFTVLEREERNPKLLAWAHYVAGDCLDALGDPMSSKFHYRQVRRKDHPDLHRKAQEKLDRLATNAN